MLLISSKVRSYLRNDVLEITWRNVAKFSQPYCSDQNIELLSQNPSRAKWIRSSNKNILIHPIATTHSNNVATILIKRHTTFNYYFWQYSFQQKDLCGLSFIRQKKCMVRFIWLPIFYCLSYHSLFN